MNFTVRTRRANGENTEHGFATEFEGISALHSAIDIHRKNGNTVTQQRPLYVFIVTNPAGCFVERMELIFPD
jgi:hypothetical protein